MLCFTWLEITECCGLKAARELPRAGGCVAVAWCSCRVSQGGKLQVLVVCAAVSLRSSSVNLVYFEVFDTTHWCSYWPNLSLCCSFTEAILFGFSRQSNQVITDPSMYITESGFQFYFLIYAICLYLCSYVFLVPLYHSILDSLTLI